MISVSIAMATYNGQRHIKKQLESLAQQTLLPAELVITDDASDDKTLEIVGDFKKDAPFPVRIYKNPQRLGYRANFMRAASLCGSDLIAFCDQDDIWYPHKLARCVEPFADAETLLVYHNADTVNEEGARLGNLANRAARRPVSSPLTLGPWWPCALGLTEVFRRSLMRLADLQPKSMSENSQHGPLAHDQWVFFLASVLGNIVYIDEPLLAYVQHAKNTFGWRKLTILELTTRIFRNRSDEYSRFARAAENRGMILKLAESDLDGAWAERAAIGQRFYHTVSSIFSERHTLYTSSSFKERLAAFQAIIKESRYATSWGLGTRALMTDMCLAIPAGHLLKL